MRQMMTKETREKLRKSSTDGLEELREKINAEFKRIMQPCCIPD